MAAHHGPLRSHEQHRYLQIPHHWQSKTATGPGRLNPTHMEMHDPHANATVQWNARQHRKHRQPHVIYHAGKGPARKWWHFRLIGLDRYIIQDLQNISWWIAQLFLWGSMCWCVNGIFLFCPPVSNENVLLYVAGYTALAGGTLFWIGAYLSVVEAVNTGVQVNFPKELLDSARRDVEMARHHGDHGQQPNGTATGSNGPVNGAVHDGHTNGGGGLAGGSIGADRGQQDTKSFEVQGAQQPRKQRWRWWGWRWHDLGWWAVIVQFIGATLFEVSVIVGTPHVLPAESDSNFGTYDVIYWSMQTVGAWGFILSALVFCWETQHRWWQPAPLKIGWQVGFWNLIGGIGFEASAICGYLAYPGMVAQKWGTYFSTFWGAWAFLIGSYFQLLECLNKRPTSLGEKKAA